MQTVKLLDRVTTYAVAHRKKGFHIPQGRLIYFPFPQLFLGYVMLQENQSKANDLSHFVIFKIFDSVKIISVSLRFPSETVQLH